MKYSIGVDLGGTFTKTGIVSADGKIVFSSSFATPKSAESIVASIAESIFGLNTQNNVDWDSIRSIGVGCPGPIRKSDGVVENLTNLPMQNFDLRRELAANLMRLGANKDIPVNLINDARAAALAEYRFGAGREFRNMVLITIGTGVGGGIITNGNLYEGGGAAGEIGHMIIAAGGRKCGCGNKGCLESYASVSALIKSAKRLREKNKNSVLNRHKILDGKIIFDCYNLGDISAQIAVKEFIHYLSIGLINVCNILHPEVVVVGGGISKLGNMLIKLIKDECEKISCGLKCVPLPIIKHAALYNDAGIIGASLL